LEYIRERERESSKSSRVQERDREFKRERGGNMEEVNTQEENPVGNPLPSA
jgi:hypothetical protein